MIAHNPPTVFPPYRNYAHAVQVPPGARTLYISGLNGYEMNGSDLPDSFEGQIENVWKHIGNILADARMTVDDLVSLRFFLTSAEFDEANVAAVVRNLGSHRAARTVVVQQLLEPGWFVEVEAIAARVGS